MNRKILFAFVVLFVAVMSISSASAFLFFDSGSDITVNGLDFHIPEGFSEDTNEHKTTDKEESVKYTNDDDYVNIIVRSVNNPDIHSVKDMDWGAHAGAMVEKSISGKDGLVSFEYNPVMGYHYFEDGKLVTVICPFILEDGTGYEDFLSTVIK